MKLDSRLSAVASLVRPGKAVCDVGTDHGYLAVFLAGQGGNPRITACDINEAPLEAARRTVSLHGMEGRIRLLLSDGLRCVPPELAEDMILCGMGGELIARILLECSYSREPERRFILQPMTRAAYLRRALYENGFTLLREIPVIDGRHRYTVMHAAWTGNAGTPSSLFCAVGKIPEETSREASLWLAGELSRAERVAAGLRGREGGPAADALAADIRDLLRRRG